MLKEAHGFIRRENHYYLSLAYSDNPEDRALAMENLCPCHVRKRIDAVWVALYKGRLTPTYVCDVPHGIHLTMAEIRMIQD